MTAQSLGHVATASNFLEHRSCEVFLIWGKEMRLAPAFVSFCLHTSSRNLAKVSNLRKVYLFSTSETSNLNSCFTSEISFCLNMDVCKPHSVLPRPDQR